MNGAKGWKWQAGAVAHLPKSPAFAPFTFISSWRNSPQVRRHIAFRDCWRANPAAAIAYENEKPRAQKLHPDSSDACSDEKAAWIRGAEPKALVWFAAQRPQ